VGQSALLAGNDIQLVTGTTTKGILRYRFIQGCGLSEGTNSRYYFVDQRLDPDQKFKLLSSACYLRYCQLCRVCNYDPSLPLSLNRSELERPIGFQLQQRLAARSVPIWIT
jgi:hypothetical protein